MELIAAYLEAQEKNAGVEIEMYGHKVIATKEVAAGIAFENAYQKLIVEKLIGVGITRQCGKRDPFLYLLDQMDEEKERDPHHYKDVYLKKLRGRRHYK